MKHQKRIGVLMGVFLFCIGAVACGKKEQEGSCVNGGMLPTLTIAPTATPIPTATVAPIDGIAISEENFGDTRFCAYLKEKFDTDKNGYFSDAELAEITVIWAGMRNILTPYSEMKGFSYFPELERLELNSATKVEICDVPKLTEIGVVGSNSVQSYQLGDVIIKNCPVLETIWIQDVTESIGEGQEFVVENCPQLQEMTVVGNSRNNFSGVSLRISGSPMLSLATYSCKPAEMVLDTTTVQSKELPVVDVKSKKVDTSGLGYITWNGETVTDYETALTELEAAVLKLEEGFFVEVQEVTPALYDEQGRKAYQVLIDNKYLSGDYYGIRDVSLGYYGEYKNDTFVMYSETPLTAEDFRFRWQELLTMPVETYSPLRGIEGQFYGTKTGENDEEIRLGLAGDLFFGDGEKQEFYGEVEVDVSYSVTPENGLQLWTELDYSENPEGIRVAEGLWLTEGSESETCGTGELPITGEYFSNLVFRDYLKEWGDLDHNGYLSLEEREAVTKIHAGNYDMGPNVVDGFEYFPNLTKIHIGICEKLVCKDCPELRLIAVEGDEPEDAVIREGTVEVVTENCPKLEVIDTSIDADEYWDNYLDW